MAACSRYFDQKFPTEVDGNSQRIVLNEINGQIAKELVGFCYTGTLKIDMENVKELILAATQLQFKIIERKCKQYLMKQMALQPEICFFVQSIDIFQKYNQLRTMAKYYALNYFSKISNFEYFNRLNIDKVIKILSDDNLVVKNEMEVFNAVIAWINFDVNNRKPCLFHLLKCVRYNDVDDTVSSFYLTKRLEVFFFKFKFFLLFRFSMDLSEMHFDPVNAQDFIIVCCKSEQIFQKVQV